MDFPAVTVCNQNRVHCGHLKQIIAANLSETNHISIEEANLLLENEKYSGEDNLTEIFSLLEDLGCRRNFDKYNETVLPGGTFGCIVCVKLYFFCTDLATGQAVRLVNHGSN